MTMKAKVWVVTWSGSYDGEIFEQVFGSKEAAEEYVANCYPPFNYSIEDFEVDIEPN